jgi:hypothetical protein
VLLPDAGPDGAPSCILRVGGLDPQTDEEALRFVFVPHAPGAWAGNWDRGRSLLIDTKGRVIYVQMNYALVRPGSLIQCCALPPPPTPA